MERGEWKAKEKTMDVERENWNPDEMEMEKEMEADMEEMYENPQVRFDQEDWDSNMEYIEKEAEKYL